MLEPNRVWVTDITYVRTHEDWLYSGSGTRPVFTPGCRVVDEFADRYRAGDECAADGGLATQADRSCHGSFGSRLAGPVESVQFTSQEWRDFLMAHQLAPSMSRHGNCPDNAVAESFLQLLKRGRIKRKAYAIRDDAMRETFDYIEMFYNPKRRHGLNDRLSPVEFERRHFERLTGV